MDVSKEELYIELLKVTKKLHMREMDRAWSNNQEQMEENSRLKARLRECRDKLQDAQEKSKDNSNQDKGRTNT